MAKVPRDRAFAMAVLFTGHGPTTFAGRQHDLHGAELPGLALDNAKMPNVILSRADLTAAKLPGAVMEGANLQATRLTSAILAGANLQDACLIDADLRWADLTGADLRGADLGHADLSGAHLTDATLDGPEQLKNAKSLYDVKGLPPDLEVKLRAENLYLFDAPVN